MADFLLELACEEIPARMQAGARAELEKLFRQVLTEDDVSISDITIWSTPRRLALIARGLPAETKAVSLEYKGPRVGAPDQAIDGFLRRYNAQREDLVERSGVYFLDRWAAGRPMSKVLQDAVPKIIEAFSWPKSMRWGEASRDTDSLRWVRPLSGILALLDGEVVPCEVGGIVAGRETFGHRFHSAGPVTIDSADDYAEKLRAAHVIVDHQERQQMIREGARAAAAEAGLVLIEDEGLVIENAGLTEWPVPLLGRFDEAFLDVPPEVIQLTARVNQKYFVCQDSAGKLANAFICTANIEARDPAVVVDGNRKVLAARLSDARFFWEQDQKTPLADHAKKLARITFHEKLGTVADKVERVAKLARWLCEEGIVKPPSVRPEPVEGPHFSSEEKNGASASSARTAEELADLAEAAARLCKADLVTEMVGEFPELQGLMGGYYAAKEGLPVEVSDAIRDHYKPVGQGDDVPTAPVTVAVSLADKLDNLLSFFKIDLLPTGSKDPFALRRAGLGYLRLIQKNGLRVHLQSAAQAWGEPSDGIHGLRVADFLFDRLGVQLKDEGVRHDYIQASRAWIEGSDTDGCLDRVELRARALTDFLSTEDGVNLLAGYKRAANILKKENHPVTPAKAGASGGSEHAPEIPASAGMTGEGEAAQELPYTPEPAEKALIDALDLAAPLAAQAVAEERFGDAMAALASLRAPIDRFFEEVIVNAEKAYKRECRLALLARFRNAVHRVADFSRIEG